MADLARLISCSETDFLMPELVIFDVDGTLYSQPMLRIFIAIELLITCVFSRSFLKFLPVLSEYRRLRENWDTERYCEDEVRTLLANKFGVSVDIVGKLLDEWLLFRPLKYLRFCRFIGLIKFMNILLNNNIKIAIFSDYPAKVKMDAMDLPFNFCDDTIDSLKPYPNRLNRIISEMNVNPAKCLLIGDRLEKDGICAARCGIKFLKKNRFPIQKGFFTYFQLINQLRNI